MLLEAEAFQEVVRVVVLGGEVLIPQEVRLFQEVVEWMVVYQKEMVEKATRTQTGFVNHAPNLIVD